MSEYIVELDSKHSIALKIAFAEEMRGGDFVRGEIVRCRDCMLAKESMIGGLMCTLVDYVEGVRPDDFCSWGERREGER